METIESNFNFYNHFYEQFEFLNENIRFMDTTKIGFRYIQRVSNI